VFRYLTDIAGYFNKNERLFLDKRLAATERQFPGLYLSIMTMEVFRLFKPREYLFWLMNRCNFSPMENRYENSFCLVIFFDAQSKTVLISTSYGLQEALPEEMLEKIISLAKPFLEKENFYEGTMTILTEIKRQLKSFCLTGHAEQIPESQLQTSRNLKPVEEMF
jgi:hypothetical protein